MVHGLVKGSNKFLLSTNEGHVFAKYVKINTDKDIKIMPYFTCLEISPQDFDKKGFIQFK